MSNTINRVPSARRRYPEGEEWDGWEISSVRFHSVDDDLGALRLNQSFFYTFRCPITRRQRRKVILEQKERPHLRELR